MQGEAQLLLLELQNEELFAKLEKEEDAKQKASSRASAAERQNKALRKKVEFLISELETLEQCWNCQDLGNRGICSKCTNNAVFVQEDNRLLWRGYPNPK